MSDYFGLYAQQRTESGWIVPPCMSLLPDQEYWTRGHLFDFKVYSAALERLFLGDDACLPLRKDIPGDFKDTELYEHFVRGSELSFQGWAPMAELYVDDWSTSSLYVSRSVPGHLAHHFTDGAQAFPMQALLDSGCSTDDCERLEDTTSAKDIRHVGRGGEGIEVLARPIVQRPRGDELPRVIEVSYSLSIADFLGGWQTEAIKAVRAEASDEDLRVICLFGG